MQGLDGNYLKMQGESLARLQVGLQAETQAQQARAQVAAEEALRRLREEVEDLDRFHGQEEGPVQIGPRDSGSSKQDRRNGVSPSVPTNEEAGLEPPAPPGLGVRIDVRI